MASPKFVSLQTGKVAALSVLAPAIGVLAHKSLPTFDAFFVSHSEAELENDGNVQSTLSTAANFFDGPVYGAGLNTINLAPKDSEWTVHLEKRLDDLAIKKVTRKLSSKEEAEYKSMVARRRRELPSRSAEEILRSAKHDQLIREIN